MRYKFGHLALLTILVTALLGGWLGDRVNAGPSDPEETRKQMRVFTEALAIVESNYARDVSSRDLVESGIRGMLRTLDPHSSFFATTDYSRLQEEQEGKYYGLGISIRAEAPGTGRVVVVEPPAPGTPAYKAGMQAGDVISRIRGESIDDWDINDEVIPNLKGPKGTTVEITVERPGETQPIDFVVERDEIPLYTIKFAFMLQPGIGYVRLDKFSETSSYELRKALQELGEPNLDGLVFDLRDNPGGSLRAAIEVADQFLEKGQVVVSTRLRGEVPDESYIARTGRRHNYPMVVLINRNSASASEIIAGALQDHHRALIVGETSFGKALVQTIFPLEGQRGLALTTGKYYTPSDRLIQRDYSEGFYDYFYSRRQSVRKSEGERNTEETGADYSGGGIAPDKEVEPRPYPLLIRQIDRQNLFYKFASALASGEVLSDIRYSYPRDEIAKLDPEEREQLMAKMTITPETVELFHQFLRQQETPVRRLEEDFKNEVEIIANRLKQQLFIQMFGEEEGFRVALELDTQVQEAINLMPQAQTLAMHRKDETKQ